MTAFVTPQIVRDYLTLQTDATSRYTDSTISSNIRTASEFLERATNRYFAQRTGVTLTLSTFGATQVDLPGGITAATSVTRLGSSLTAGQTYELIPDSMQSGVYVALTLPGYGTDYRRYPEWFDRNLDSPYNPINWGSGPYAPPNDLVIVANVGYAPADYPEELLMACKVLAAWYTKRPDAVLSGATQTPDGNSLGLDDFPPEVSQFISDWKIGTHSAVSL